MKPSFFIVSAEILEITLNMDYIVFPTPNSQCDGVWNGAFGKYLGLKRSGGWGPTGWDYCPLKKRQSSLPLSSHPYTGEERLCEDTARRRSLAIQERALTTDPGGTLILGSQSPQLGEVNFCCSVI